MRYFLTALSIAAVACGNPGGKTPAHDTGYKEPTPAQLNGLSQDADPRLDRLLDPRAGATMPTVMPSADLTASLPAPLNQGQMGSCAAFTNTIIGSLARTRVEGSKKTVSPAFLYERMLTLSQANCKDGTYIHTGLETLMKEGAPLENEAPYSDAMCTSGTSPGADAARSRIGGYNKLEPFDRTRVKEVITTGIPVPFGATLPPNFMDYKSAEVFKSNDGQAGGPHGGGHAMVIVGYDDAKSAYRIQNSWGTDWGDQGYIWWDYADFEARAGLHAFVPDLLPAGMTVDPNPTMATLTVDITGAVQFTYGTLTGVAIRIDGSGPFHLTNVTVTALSTQDDFDEELIYGDITLPLTAAVAPGTYEASISGDVAGTAFTKGIMFTIGAPVVLQ